MKKYRKRTVELHDKKCAFLNSKDAQPGDPLNIFSFQSVFYLVLCGLCAGILCFIFEKAWNRWRALKTEGLGERRFDFGLVAREGENMPPRLVSAYSLQRQFPRVRSVIPSEGPSQYSSWKTLPEILELISCSSYFSAAFNDLQKLDEAEMEEKLKQFSEELALFVFRNSRKL